MCYQHQTALNTTHATDPVQVHFVGPAAEDGGAAWRYYSHSFVPASNHSSVQLKLAISDGNVPLRDVLWRSLWEGTEEERGRMKAQVGA